MRHYVIASSCGVRMWDADDLDHAKEQHNDCFEGDDTEVIEAAVAMEDLVRVAMQHGLIDPDGFTEKAREFVEKIPDPHAPLQLPPDDVVACGARPDVPLCEACIDAYRNGIEPGGTACDDRFDAASRD